MGAMTSSKGNSENGYELAVNEAAGRYELRIGGQVAGYAEYQRRGDTLVLPHTVVEPEFRGQGLSSPLIKHALDDARVNGLTVIPQCSAVAGYIERHPEYRDLVA